MGLVAQATPGALGQQQLLALRYLVSGPGSQVLASLLTNYVTLSL